MTSQAPTTSIHASAWELDPNPMGSRLKGFDDGWLDHLESRIASRWSRSRILADAAALTHYPLSPARVNEYIDYLLARGVYSLCNGDERCIHAIDP